MIKETVISLVITSLSLAASGQGLELVNLNVGQSESKTIYVGIQNKFKITNFSALRKIEPASSVLLIHEDTLVVKPHTAGSLALTFYTEHGKQEVVFSSQVISNPVITIGDGAERVVDKSEVIKQGSIRISSANPNDIFFDNYTVSSFEARVNAQTFSLKGNKFSPELLAAIGRAQRGDQLVLSSVKATNARVSGEVSVDKATYVLK